MAKKYRFSCVVVVPDPSQDIAEVRNAVSGNIEHARILGTRHVPVGEPVEVSDEEAERIYRIVGSWEDYEASQLAQKNAEEQRRKAGGGYSVLR